MISERKIHPSFDAAGPMTEEVVSTAPRCKVHFTINGEPYRFALPTWVTLLDLLRDRIGLTGTKKGCDHGQCGACTVLVNGRRINACLTLAVMQNGAEITTVEGLAALAEPAGAAGPRGMHPLQRSFIAHDALQCGYCTPGQLCSAVGLLNEHPCENEAELRERMSGNICRCGAYPQIVQAVAQVMWQPGAGAHAGGDPRAAR